MGNINENKKETIDQLNARVLAAKAKLPEIFEKNYIPHFIAEYPQYNSIKWYNRIRNTLSTTCRSFNLQILEHFEEFVSGLNQKMSA